MPGLDLCAAGICRTRGALLLEKRHQAAAAQGRVHLGRGAVAGATIARFGTVRVQCTDVKNRATRNPDSQVHTGWLRMPRSHDPTTASARPIRLSIGNRPTPPSRTGTRLSAELSRLSPITNRWPGGTVTSGVLSSQPLSRSLKIACDTTLGNVSA